MFLFSGGTASPSPSDVDVESTGSGGGGKGEINDAFSPDGRTESSPRSQASKIAQRLESIAEGPDSEEEDEGEEEAEDACQQEDAEQRL